MPKKAPPPAESEPVEAEEEIIDPAEAADAADAVLGDLMSRVRHRQNRRSWPKPPQPPHRPRRRCRRRCRLTAAPLRAAHRAQTHEVIDEKVMTDKTYPAAVRLAAAEIMGVVEYRYTKPDGGTSVDKQQGPTWCCDEEPPASRLDTWARGAVPIKIRPKLKIEPVEDDEGVPGSHSPPPPCLVATRPLHLASRA